jgi:NAD(P)-dependent dehydrogenase (short-subunit alcohol dehydrogenase family)
MNSSHEELTSGKLFDVKDLVVVITGGGTGIGQMMTRAMMANGARKVYIVGRRLDVLQTTANEFSSSSSSSSGKGIIIPIQADLSKKSEVDGLRKKLEAEEKFIDLLVSVYIYLCQSYSAPKKRQKSTLILNKYVCVYVCK